VKYLGENELIKIARLEEQMVNMKETQDTILKRLDDRESRSNQQLFMTALSLVSIIATLAIVLIQGGVKP